MDPLLARARAAWPQLKVDGAAFLKHLAARPGAVHVEDLYLAFACQLGLPSALTAFEEKHLSQVASFLDGPARTQADEVRQLLRVRLFVAKQISTYSGRGALGGFVRVAAVRMARDVQRGKANAEGAGDSDELPVDSPDPELAYLKKRHAADFKRAFQTTLAALPDEDRNILSLSLFDALTTEAIGQLYRVDGSTIRRRLAKMRQTILDETLRLLTERLKLKPAELDSLLQVVRSQLDLSIRRALKP